MATAQVTPLPIAGDTTATAVDSIPADTSLAYRISPDGLDDEAEYGSNDSSHYDHIKGEMHLWGQAYVRYLNMSVEAGYIVFNIDSNIATAKAWPDSSGALAGYPLFKEGSNQFEARMMRYNFKSSKGKIYDVATEQGDLIVRGAETKYVGSGGDTTKSDYIYNEGAIITSCRHPEPHYGIRAKRIKTVPNRFAVIGPSNVQIQGVPTPLWLPFGFFPVTTTRRAGLIFPQDYEYNEAWGYGLRGIGYYTPIGEHLDARILADIYFNGSWGLQLQSSYAKRYKYRGSFTIGHSVRKRLDRGELEQQVIPSWNIRLSHNQDPNAHPYNTFGGSINIQTQNYASLNSNAADDVLQATFNSNFSWRRTFPNRPYSLSAALNHSQNTRTGQMTLDLPVVDFRLNRIYPFKGVGDKPGEQWYEKFSIQYQANSRTRMEFQDSVFFQEEMWESAQSGIKHRANADFAFTIAKYLHFTPQVDYEEVWSFKYLEKQFVWDPDEHIVYDTIMGDDGSIIVVPDTINFGPTEDQYRGGFKPVRRLSSGISLNTQLFATMQMKKGPIRGFRHVLKPTISFSYTPETKRELYLDSVRNDIRYDTSYMKYSIFQGTAQSFSPVTQRQTLISYSFNNIFEAKTWSKKDSATRKVKLFDNIVVNGNYNFAADSLHWSPVMLRATTRLLKQATTFSLNAVWDPYDVSESGRRIDQFYWDNEGKPLRFVQLQMRFATRLTVRKIQEIFKGEKSTGQSGGANRQRGGAGNRRQASTGPDKFFDLFNGFTLNHNFLLTRVGRPGRDTTIIGTHTVNLRGQMNLTPKWSINIGNIGYDIKNKRVTYPDIGFSRDLHCWQMSFSWQPERGTYSLSIGVKPGTLDFLKLPHQNNNQTADRFGGY